MAIQASCSHCDYARDFSAGLSGRFYRCPKCGDGVIAIPRASDEVSQTWRIDHDSWLEQSAARIGVEKPSLESDEESEAPESIEDAALEDASASSAEPPAPNHKGRVASARKILVECALCRFLVRIPPEFFGKTVHCPNCRGDTMFTESVLEPVKDELIDRLYLESRERGALGSVEELQDEAGGPKRPFLMGILIGLGLLMLIWGTWNVLQTRRRSAAVMRALDEQWRWAVDEAAHLVHEPWCRDLPASFERLPADEIETRQAEGYRLHTCR
jgi:hypothetical protein